MKQLSDKAISVLGRGFDYGAERLNLQKIYGPADRHGVTEWMAGSIFEGEPDDQKPVRQVHVFISLAAWHDDDSNEFSLMAEAKAAVRTREWVVQPALVEQQLFVNSSDIDEQIAGLVASVVANKRLEEAAYFAATNPAYRRNATR